MTKISFVCPIFNKKKYLKIVLSSIKKQVGSFEKEYIFIDDGSTDGSLDYLKKKLKNGKIQQFLVRKIEDQPLQLNTELVWLRVII